MFVAQLKIKDALSADKATKMEQLMRQNEIGKEELAQFELKLNESINDKSQLEVVVEEDVGIEPRYEDQDKAGEEIFKLQLQNKDLHY